LGNNHDNFQLHRFAKSENIAKRFRGGTTFLTHTVYTVQISFIFTVLYNKM